MTTKMAFIYSVNGRRTTNANALMWIWVV